jgi:hypothetical protein
VSDEIVTCVQLDQCAVTIFGPYQYWNNFQPWSRIILESIDRAEVCAKNIAKKHGLEVYRVPAAYSFYPNTRVDEGS